jgi:hypothetical protein
VEIETMDKGGTFLGSLTIPGPRPANIGLVLLREGLAKLHPSFDPSRIAGGQELLDAQQAAKEARVKVGGLLVVCRGIGGEAGAKRLPTGLVGWSVCGVVQRQLLAARQCGGCAGARPAG